MLQASSSWVRRDFARILAQKFGHARWLIVGGERSAIEQQCAASGIAATLCPTALDLDGTSARNDSSRQFERAVWFYPASKTNEQRDREVDVLAHQANSQVDVVIATATDTVAHTHPLALGLAGRTREPHRIDVVTGDLAPRRVIELTFVAVQ